MPYYSYGDFLANNIYCILLIPILLLSLWAQFQVSGNFRRRRQCCGRTVFMTWASAVSGEI